MNKFLAVGRLTKDPELQITQTSKKNCVRVNLAVDRNISKEDKEAGKKSADFIPLVFWDKTAEILVKYCKKGHRIAIEGRLVDGVYEKEDGTKVYTLDVHVTNLEFLENKNKDSRPEPEYTGYETKETTQQEFNQEIEIGPDDLPF